MIVDKKLGIFIAAGLLLSLFLATVVSPCASTSPDGLEKVAGVKGFLEKASTDPAWRWSLIPDYLVPGIENKSMGTGIAGLIGTLLVFGLGFGLAKVIARKKKTENIQGNEQ